MKKFFALFICAFIAVTVVVGATELNAKQKFETKAALSLASGGVMFRVPARNLGSDYEKLRTKYPDNPVISRSYIRMEQYLVNGKSEYRFDHTRQSTDAPTENKLADQDAFFVTDIGIFLLAESTTVPGIGVLQTYPNPVQFPNGASAAFLQNADLEHLYNGKFSIKIGDTTWLPDQPIFDCRVVNTAQQTALATNDSERHPGDGFIACHPKPTLLGMENNELKLIVPANSLQKVETDAAAAGFKTKVVCILTGYKITGAGRNTK